MSEKKKEFSNIYEVLRHIQINLHAPKSQYNKFGGYHFRNCEDIQQGLKDVLPEGAAVYVTDSVQVVEGRFYIKATAILCFGDKCISNDAFAREPVSQKGMNDSQLTGSASSYARKYALGGLFLVDDQKDADSQDNKSNAGEVTKEKTPDPRKEMQEYIQAVRKFKTPDGVSSFIKGLVPPAGMSDTQSKWLNDQINEHIKSLSVSDEPHSAPELTGDHTGQE